MLETIRAYATERLASTADEQAVRERHYLHYLAMAQRHGTERALWGASGKEHLASLDAETDNLHAALGWAIAQANAIAVPKFKVKTLRPVVEQPRPEGSPSPRSAASA